MAAPKNPFITFEIKKTGVALDPDINIADQMNSVLRKSLQAIGNHLAERVIAASPILTGALRADIRAGNVQDFQGKVEVKIVSGVPYAGVIHQHQVKGEGPIIYGLGPGSAAADAAGSGAESGGVGGGAMIRAANFWAPIYLEKLKKDIVTHMGDALQGKSITISAIRI